jgi:hypothetical protein
MIHMPQCIKIGSGRSEMFGATAVKAYFLYGALTNIFFTADTTNLSTSGKFAQIVSATQSNPWEGNLSVSYLEIYNFKGSSGFDHTTCGICHKEQYTLRLKAFQPK